MSFADVLARDAGLIQARLDLALAGKADLPVVHAMRYAVQGGKRLRGFLVLESARMLGVAEERAISAAAAIDRIKQLGPRSIKFVCLLACPEGVAALQKAHPDVPIFTAAIDRQLNDHGYILPGLGDAGDRIFGTQ